MSTANQHKVQNLFGWIICSFLIGPLAVVLLRFWKGFLLLLLPVIVCCAIAYFFLDSQLTKLVHYPLTLQVWGAVYWVLCIIATIEEVKAQNQIRLEEKEEQPNRFQMSPVQSWLQQNPGKTINDYYRHN